MNSIIDLFLVRSLKADNSEFVGEVFSVRFFGMKSVERIERLPKFGCRLESLRFDIFVGNRLAVPFPDAKDFQSGKSAVGVKGALCPMDGTGDGSGSSSGDDGFGFLCLAESFLRSLK